MNFFARLFSRRARNLEMALKATVILLELKNRSEFDERTEGGIKRACGVIDGGDW